MEAGDDMEHWEAFMSSALVDEDINFFSVWVFCAGVVLLLAEKFSGFSLSTFTLYAPGETSPA